MKRLGLIVALIIIALGAWFDWTYHAAQTDVAELSASLPSVEDLSKGTPEENAEKLYHAVESCARVDRLSESFVARYVRGAEIKELTEQCDLIRAQAEAVEGP
jgi:predicted negative regulator of RcsB-dependent stress response